MIGKTISHYKILEKLGQGGMGVVYKAHDAKLDRDVAIKVLHPAVTTGELDRERFIVEAKAAAALNYSHIATIHTIEEFESQLFIVMEYIQGQELNKDKTFDNIKDINDLIDIAKQIAMGLNVAHNKGIVHRDIKSSNIMLTDDGRIKIMDFGLAKFADSKDITKEQSTLGTVAYMAPEQIKGQPGTQQSDIFSYGVVLYELLTGTLPFDGEYEAAILYAIMNEEPEPVIALRADCPASLSDIVATCLAKDPRERFQSMEEVLAALVDDSFRSTATASSNHNLPVQLTSFIGREKEITTVQQFLKGHRLVTLTGAGGCGKTRLAQQTVLGVVHNYADGARWVELAPLSGPQTIPQTIAAALGVKEEPGKPLQETVTLFLRDRKLLLIMDNCEHLIAACSSIVESLLNSAPGLSVLATSREALNLAGEFSWTVPSLSIPPDDHYLDAEQLSKFESTRLFSERARVVRPNFSITMDSATSITDICRRLDGIPLAIELAAARIKLLSPPDILQRLNNRFRLLTGGSRTAIERHKTLRATIDWSYDLLSKMEKTLFNRLSVFAGGFEMESVEKTCSFDPVRDDEILDLFSSLTDKSLVVTETTKNGSYRYHLLETLREYAREKLIETNEIETARAAHFAHFGDMSEHAYDTWLEFSPKWLQQLETEHENLRAALEWSSRKNVLGYCKMVGALVWFWYEHAHATECYHHLCAALEKHNEKDATTARLLTEKAFIDAEFQFNIDIALAEKSIAIWRELGDKKELAIALTNLLTIRLDGNIPENAEPLLDEATDIFKELGDKRQLLRANTYGCFLHVVNFNAEKALSLAEYNIQLAKEFDMTFFVYLNQHFYGDATLLTDDYINGEIRYGVALKNAVDSENWIQALYELRGVSNAVSGQRRYIKALRLSGAIDKKWSELLNYNEDDMPVKFWAFLKNKHLGSARKVVGANAFKYEEEGRNMDFEKAVAYALDFDAD